jgi:hypothetical protein
VRSCEMSSQLREVIRLRPTVLYLDDGTALMPNGYRHPARLGNTFPMVPGEKMELQKQALRKQVRNDPAALPRLLNDARSR